MRPVLRPLLNLAIVAGILIAASPLIESGYAHWSQHQLSEAWDAQAAPAQAGRPTGPVPPLASPGIPHATAPALPSLPVAVGGTPRARLADPDGPDSGQAAPAPKAPPWPLTKLTIPDLNLETFVVQGIDGPSLRRGPGHDPDSAMPGSGNCVIVGHRNVYGSYFYNLDQLMTGAPIVLQSRKGTYTYQVSSLFAVADADLDVLDPPAPGAPPELTLITCTLPHTDNRLILRATLEPQATPSP